MRISGREYKQLHEALLCAFPDFASLTMMVRSGLDRNLTEIAGDSNLSAAVTDLLKWAEAQGQLQSLVEASLRAVPGNLEMKAFAECHGLVQSNGAVQGHYVQEAYVRQPAMKGKQMRSEEALSESNLERREASPEVSLRFESKTQTASAVLTITGSVRDFDTEKTQQILAMLREVTCDPQLTITKIASGSVKLTIEASEQTIALLKSLILENQIKSIHGHNILAIHVQDEPANSSSYVDVARQTVTNYETRRKGLSAKVTDDSDEMYLAGEMVPPGTYKQVGSSREVTLEFEDFLPASDDGRVACYTRVQTWLDPQTEGWGGPGTRGNNRRGFRRNN